MQIPYLVFAFLLVIEHTVHCQGNPRQASDLQHLLGDVGKCVSAIFVAKPLHLAAFSRRLVMCFKSHLHFCLIERPKMSKAEIDHAISKPRYCGFYRSDLHLSKIKLSIRVLKHHGISLNIFYFSLQWIARHCPAQGVILDVSTPTSSAHCGKRLPWQFIHTRSNLSIEVYTYNSLLSSWYFNFFYGLNRRKRMNILCNQIFAPASIDLRIYSMLGCKDFHIITDLQNIISVEITDISSLILYDGPGKRSPIYILILNRVLESSSSQIVISVLDSAVFSGSVRFSYIYQFSLSRLRNLNCFRYISMDGIESTKINVQFRNHAGNYICHYMFHGSRQLNFNSFVNITKFAFDGPTIYTHLLNIGCQYGGIYFHTKDEIASFGLKVEMCGNIEQITPRFISFPEEYLLLSMVWYKGYSSGMLRADGHVMQCGVDVLACGRHERHIMYLSAIASWNIFYFNWNGTENDRHNCEYTIRSRSSSIIGPSHIYVVTTKNNKPITADMSIYLQYYNDWPVSPSIKQDQLSLNIYKFQEVSRRFRYLKRMDVSYKGFAQLGRHILISVKVVSCFVVHKEELNNSTQSIRIIDHNCWRLYLRPDQSTFFIYAPASKQKRLAIYTEISSLCQNRSSYTLHVMEYKAATKYLYNYTIADTMNMRYISKYTGADIKFFLTAEVGLGNISTLCKINIFVKVQDETPNITTDGLIQLSGRKLNFFPAR